MFLGYQLKKSQGRAFLLPPATPPPAANLFAGVKKIISGGEGGGEYIERVLFYVLSFDTYTLVKGQLYCILNKNNQLSIA